MRKLTIFCLLGYGLIMNVTAQKPQLGIEASPSLSWFSISGENIVTSGIRPGLTIGLIFEKPFSDRYAFATGLTIRSLSGSLRFSQPDSIILNNKATTFNKDEELILRIQTIDIPLGIKLRTEQYGSTTFYGEVGIDALLRLKATATQDGTEDLANSDANEFIQPFSLAYNLGVGTEILLDGGTTLIFGLGYTDGLMNLVKNQNYNLSTKSLELKLGILF